MLKWLLNSVLILSHLRLVLLMAMHLSFFSIFLVSLVEFDLHNDFHFLKYHHDGHNFKNIKISKLKIFSITSDLKTFNVWISPLCNDSNSTPIVVECWNSLHQWKEHWWWIECQYFVCKQIKFCFIEKSFWVWTHHPYLWQKATPSLTSPIKWSQKWDPRHFYFFRKKHNFLRFETVTNWFGVKFYLKKQRSNPYMHSVSTIPRGRSRVCNNVSLTPGSESLST